jgi:Uma2 family endonuclease
VKVVLVVDPETSSVGVFRPNELPVRFHNGDVVTLPEVSPAFAVPASKFFE